VTLLTYCWFCVGGSFHEAAHQTLFRSPSVNLWVGRVLGMMIGIPYTAYRETHRRHHAYLNTTGDYELWPYSDPRRSLTFRRAFVWFDLLGGVVTAPYIYSRIYWTRDRRLSPEVRRAITFEYLLMAIVWSFAVGALVFAARQTGFQWSDFQFVWLLPLVLSPMVNTVRKFVEHLGMTSTDPLLGTRTVAFGNPLTALLCYFNFDIAVHGPHHRFPRAQHYELAPRLTEYQSAHPESKAPVFRSYLAAVWNPLPCLWRKPATGSRDEPFVAEQTAFVDGWGGASDQATFVDTSPVDRA
jgi:fatty acid desaturase